MQWQYHGRILGRTRPEPPAASPALPGHCTLSFAVEVEWSPWQARSPAALALSGFRGLVGLDPHPSPDDDRSRSGRPALETGWRQPDDGPHWHLVRETPGSTRLTFTERVPLSLLDAFEHVRDGRDVTVTYWLRCRADAIEMDERREPTGIRPPYVLSEQSHQQLTGDAWRRVLEQAGFFAPRVLDVRVRDRVDLAALARAEQALVSAREALARGDHAEAVRQSRIALEDVRRDMADSGVEAAGTTLRGRYRGYVDALLRVAHPAAHADSTQAGEAVRYTRADALFLIESTAALIVRAARERW